MANEEEADTRLVALFLIVIDWRSWGTLRCLTEALYPITSPNCGRFAIRTYSLNFEPSVYFLIGWRYFFVEGVNFDD